MALLTTPIILLEYQGYTKLYSDVSEYSIAYFLLSIVLFLIFTDSSIYWIHRLEHDIPLVYKYCSIEAATTEELTFFSFFFWS